MNTGELKLQFKPSDFILEVLGEPASEMNNPVNAGYQCPFANTRCIKRSHLIEDPFPVCSMAWRKGTGANRKFLSPVCVCPKRLYQPDVFQDIVNYCWPGKKPLSYKPAYEVSLASLGKIDCVLAETDSSDNITQFVSVEFQTVDITGSYFTAYESLLNQRLLDKVPKYNFNWRNVYKRSNLSKTSLKKL